MPILRKENLDSVIIAAIEELGSERSFVRNLGENDMIFGRGDIILEYWSAFEMFAAAKQKVREFLQQAWQFSPPSSSSRWRRR